MSFASDATLGFPPQPTAPSFRPGSSLAQADAGNSHPARNSSGCSHASTLLNSTPHGSAIGSPSTPHHDPIYEQNQLPPTLLKLREPQHPSQLGIIYTHPARS
ncbi:hypothetical protein BJ085DRAFT_35862 [Dimargaris cristalligena]|uniref:Uncharacterized protein n=1 Tax=Dimargaris cristalligena TaxID=215637 RepID=A0A4P9ZRZ8_9FUNG|nr:hypothetical protein BJ085DRAFT_35862 [Dimargaris cristalligena]|eukprot:RKP36165.1 hypothetical protein BJ085DRAFT_35862 [Dimargaris cristalligena]